MIENKYKELPFMIKTALLIFFILTAPVMTSDNPDEC